MEVINENGMVIGFLHRNIVIDKNLQTAGIILDSTLYNKEGKSCGKYEGHYFRNSEGHIIGKTKPDTDISAEMENVEAILAGGWKIVERIHNFEYVNVPLSAKWDAIELTEFLA